MKQKDIYSLLYNEIQANCLQVALESLQEQLLDNIADSQSYDETITYSKRLSATNDLLIGVKARNK